MSASREWLVRRLRDAHAPGGRVGILLDDPVSRLANCLQRHLTAQQFYRPSNVDGDSLKPHA